MPKSKAEEQRQWVADNVYSATEAAQYLGVSREAIYKAVSYARLEAIKGKMFLKSDLDELRANSHKIKKTKAEE